MAAIARLGRLPGAHLRQALGRHAARVAWAGRWLGRSGFGWPLPVTFRRTPTARQEHTHQHFASYRLLQLSLALRSDVHAPLAHVERALRVLGTRGAVLRELHLRLSATSTRVHVQAPAPARAGAAPLPVRHERWTSSHAVVVRTAPLSPRAVGTTLVLRTLAAPLARIERAAAPALSAPAAWPRPRQVLARAAAPAPSSPAAQAAARPSRIGEPAGFQARAPFEPAAPSPLQVEQLAEQVMRHIDRRVIAARERLGRI
ncbi:hypothetical protein [Sorangium sp. So ce341]|uniref:hypothetical protein n=1 Tax=Sorangium sp. So ce341 TaxID=3133302 RepID=UPI003F5FB46C